MLNSFRTIRPALYLALLSLAACEKSGEPTHSLEVAKRGIYSGALSEKGELAVIGSITHGGSFWRVDSMERVFNWNHKSGDYTVITTTDFSYNGRWALTANPYNLVLWDTRSGRGERFWTAPGEILDAELGPDANMAILGLSDHTAVIFNTKQGGILRTLSHNNHVRSVDLNRDGSLALTGSEDYTVNLWDLASGEKISSIKHNDDVQLVKLSPDGSLALSVSKYDKALLWETRSGKRLTEIPLTAHNLKRGLRFTCARISEDNSRLLTGRPDGVIDLWDIASLSKALQSQPEQETERSATEEKLSAAKIARWTLPKRQKWNRTPTAAIDVSFSEETNTFYAIASNGFIHTLKIAESQTSDKDGL